MQVEFPIFRKDNVGVYKIIDDKTCIQASNGYMPEIAFCEPSLAYYLDSSIESNEAEFLDGYYEVRKKLDDLSLIKL